MTKTIRIYPFSAKSRTEQEILTKLLLIVVTLTSPILCDFKGDSVCQNVSCDDYWQSPIQDYTDIYQFPDTPPDGLILNCCESCTCDGTVCHAYGDPCLSVFNPQFTFDSQLHFSACNHMQLRPYSETSEFPYNMISIYVIRQCDLQFEPTELEVTSYNKCMHANTYVDVDTKIPVSDMFTGLTYLNKYCAICNEVPEWRMVFWSASIVCVTEPFWPRSWDTVVEDIQETSDCNVFYHKPNTVGLVPPSCKLTEAIFCNAELIIISILEDGISYFVGGMYDDPVCADKALQPPLTTTFEIRLEYEPSETNQASENRSTANSSCGKTMFYDKFKDTCRKLTCLPPKWLVNEGCETLKGSVGGQILEINLKMTPTRNVTTSLFSLLSSELLVFGKSLLGEFKKYSKVLLLCKSDANSSATESLDSMEYFILQLKITILPSLIVDTILIDDMLAFDHSNQAIMASQDNQTDFDTELVPIELVRNKNGDTKYVNYALNGVILNRVSSYRGPLYITLRNLSTTVVLPTSKCPLVQLSAFEFEFKIFPGWIEIANIDATVTNTYYLKSNDTGNLVSVMLCADTYKELVQTYLHNQTHDPSTTQHSAIRQTPITQSATTLSPSINVSQYWFPFSMTILSHGSTWVSVTCLLLTILTHWLYKENRTHRGISIIFLCVSLAVAQTIFLFACNTDENILKQRCRTIGALVHFSWLFTMIWVNRCSFLIINVLRSVSANDTDSDVSVKKLWVHFYYAMIIAIVPVVIVQLISLRKEQDDTRYNGGVCFIPDRLCLWFSFALPGCILLLTSISMYIVVIKMIKGNIHVVGNQNMQTRHVTVYFMLSCLIGCFWAFGIGFMFTGHTYLEVLNHIFSASLGISVFICLACNNAVFQRYKQLLKSISKYDRNADNKCCEQ